ncbi:MAG TPA: protein kinase [Polyangiaceae bacterium]
MGDSDSTLPGPQATWDPRIERVPPEDIFRTGDLVGGMYEIRSVLGSGGNGQVYEAHDRLLNRRVALKAAWPSDPRLGTLLRREAQALAAIRHPTLVTVHALGVHEGTDYFVMELVLGVTLEDHLARHKKTGEPLGLDEALDTLIAIAEGLAAVHRSGIAHRDVKPGNIMLAPGNRVVLTDFGLVVPEFAAGAEFTGTPMYMAPETILGEVRPGTAHLVDTYALGVLAFELVTGAHPYDAPDVAGMVRQQVEAPVPELTGVSPKLAELIREMMAKDPDARPQQLEGVVWRLRALRTRRADASAKAFGVVIVDDDKDIARLISMYVRAAAPKAEVTIATRAAAALELVRAHPPTLMIFDLMMPEMNGIELYMYLRGERLAEHCTIVAVSAGASPGDVELLYELGVAHFIPKGPELRPRITDIARELYALVEAGTGG